MPNYRLVTDADRKIMAGETEAKAQTYAEVYRSNPMVLQKEIAAIERTRAALREGNPALFKPPADGHDDVFADVGYYFADPKSPTGAAVIGQGTEGWNPNLAAENLQLQEDAMRKYLQMLENSPEAIQRTLRP